MRSRRSVPWGISVGVKCPVAGRELAAVRAIQLELAGKSLEIPPLEGTFPDLFCEGA